MGQTWDTPYTAFADPPRRPLAWHRALTRVADAAITLWLIALGILAGLSVSIFLVLTLAGLYRAGHPVLAVLLDCAVLIAVLGAAAWYGQRTGRGGRHSR
jgi:hypothetical protein